MTSLEFVIFTAPVPIPRTHRREPLFDAADGWTIQRDDAGDFHIAGHGLAFVTDGFVSWVPMPPPAPKHLEIPPELKAKARRAAKQILAPTKLQEIIKREPLDEK